jgi:hypothetical protein
MNIEKKAIAVNKIVDALFEAGVEKEKKEICEIFRVTRMLLNAPKVKIENIEKYFDLVKRALELQGII